MSDKNMRAEITRRSLAGASLCVPVLVVIISWLAWRDALPAELASHWSGSGPADDAMAVGTLLALNLALSGVPAVAGVAVSFWPGISARARRGTYFFLGVFGGMGAVTWLLSAGLTMQVGDPYEVVLGPWVIVSIVAAGYGLIPFAISPKPRVEATDVARRFEFAPSETGAWSQTITGNMFAWVAIGLIVLGSVIYGPAVIDGRVSDQFFGIAVMSAAILLVASFIRLRVTADWRGLRVVSAIFRIPLKRIRLEAIDMIEAAELRPTEWGGWGYRIMPGRSAVILRKGPGLIVTTTNQKQFAITLDDPETPAALLATLRDGNSAAPGDSKEVTS
ncbi:hypothetical protein E3O06_01225 [Cryobacterium glaciale]|uniref:DUF1648 domain-containing protein n=1 Tax=Cryobacterium glaciale TaxID=1259145 RepID=A0A4R8V4S3_9MICO|nr:hypothetical protein [Cryobacterium glaciale]TFB77398.1 hypothetical protein E3O06_01225 [Cryobacterium glaciale]